MLFIRSGMIANRCDNLFPKILVMGISMLLVFQALSNMAVAVHLIPVTGQPLPLISRGGTSTLINCIYIGIILSVSRYENPKGAKREDEIVQEMEMEKEIAEIQNNNETTENNN
jgi:cell division protein FtsW